MSKVGRFLHIREASRATSKASSASNTSDSFLRGGILARLNRALAQFQQIPQRPLLFLFFSLMRGQARPNVIVAKFSGHAKQVKAVKATGTVRFLFGVVTQWLRIKTSGVMVMSPHWFVKTQWWLSYSCTPLSFIAIFTLIRPTYTNWTWQQQFFLKQAIQTNKHYI